MLEQNSGAESASLAGIGRPARYQRGGPPVGGMKGVSGRRRQTGPDGEHNVAEAD